MPRGTGMYRRQLLRSSTGAPLDDPAVRAHMAEGLAAAQCSAGDHKQETDAETGSEVCPWCKTVLDDYSDVDGVEARQGVRHDPPGSWPDETEFPLGRRA